MIVRFVSTETGEVLMFANVAKTLLQVVGKESTKRGVFTPPEMLPAVAALRAAVAEDEARQVPVDEDDEEEIARRKKEPVIVLRQRAWPLIDMLERTASAGPDASIVWEAKEDF